MKCTGLCPLTQLVPLFPADRNAAALVLHLCSLYEVFGVQGLNTLAADRVKLSRVNALFIVFNLWLISQSGLPGPSRERSPRPSTASPSALTLYGGTWNCNGVILFSGTYGDGIFSVAAA